MNKYFEENKENMIRQLDIWAYRIQHIAYCLQLEKWRKTHKTPMKAFYPNENGLTLTKALQALVDDKITPEEAWSVLHSPEMQYELEDTARLEEKYGKELPRWAK